MAIIRTIGVCICANSHGVCGTRAHAHAPKIYANIACYTKTGVRSRIPYCVPARSVRRNAIHASCHAYTKTAAGIAERSQPCGAPPLAKNKHKLHALYLLPASFPALPSPHVRPTPSHTNNPSCRPLDCFIVRTPMAIRHGDGGTNTQRS